MDRHWRRSDLLGLTSLNKWQLVAWTRERCSQWTQLAHPGSSVKPVPSAARLNFETIEGQTDRY